MGTARLLPSCANAGEGFIGGLQERRETEARRADARLRGDVRRRRTSPRYGRGGRGGRRPDGRWPPSTSRASARLVYFEDTEGNLVGAMQYESADGVHVDLRRRLSGPLGGDHLSGRLAARPPRPPLGPARLLQQRRDAGGERRGRLALAADPGDLAAGRRRPRDRHEGRGGDALPLPRARSSPRRCRASRGCWRWRRCCAS